MKQPTDTEMLDWATAYMFEFGETTRRWYLHYYSVMRGSEERVCGKDLRDCITKAMRGEQ